MSDGSDRLHEIHWRALELRSQLRSRARLYQLLGATEISEEFDRLSRVEVDPIVTLSEPGDSRNQPANARPASMEGEVERRIRGAMRMLEPSIYALREAEYEPVISAIHDDGRITLTLLIATVPKLAEPPVNASASEGDPGASESL